METNETRKGKYSKIILKETKIPKKNKPNKEELKHEPIVVEITHLCIRHAVQTSLYYMPLKIHFFSYFHYI
jgi:hypothetical protein